MDMSLLLRNIVYPALEPMSRRAQKNTNVLLITHQQVRERSPLDWFVERRSLRIKIRQYHLLAKI